MRESLMYGSVRGTRGNSRPYRDRRRDFILAGMAAAWSLAARAQQPERMRRIGVLFHLAESDLEGQARLVVLAQRLKELGWTDGGNMRLDIRWAAGD
jgi:putative ABC transport system substrate-binding protein